MARLQLNRIIVNKLFGSNNIKLNKKLKFYCI